MSLVPEIDFAAEVLETEVVVKTRKMATSFTSQSLETAPSACTGRGSKPLPMPSGKRADTCLTPTAARTALGRSRA
jgi:hypothetical protein